MPDLVIKPTATSGNKLILQDQAGGAVLTTSDSGASLGTISGGTLQSGVTITDLKTYKIGGASFSSASEVELGQDLGSYKVHKLYMYVTSSSTSGGREFYMRFKNASGWITSSYAFVNFFAHSGDTSASCVTGEGQSFIRLDGDGTRTDRKIYIEMSLYNLVATGGTNQSSASWTFNTPNHDADTNLTPSNGHGQVNDLSTITDIKFYPNSDTITGEWVLFGLNW